MTCLATCILLEKMLNSMLVILNACGKGMGLHPFMF